MNGRMIETPERVWGFEYQWLMRDISPESPEERLKHPDTHPHRPGLWGHIGPGSRPFEATRRVIMGVYNEGFIHAGNLAYFTLLAIFPFFIVAAAFATVIGRPEDLDAFNALLTTLPPSVAAMVKSTANEVISARTGTLLWLGALIGIWTVGSFIETIREVLRRAYGTDYARPFWQYRLIGVLLIFGAVALLMIAFSMQIVLTTAEDVIARYVPGAHRVADQIGNTRFIPMIATFVGNYLIFWTLAPTKYRGFVYPKWPGALFTTFWWYVSVTLLPKALAQFGGYTLTYGGLAGVMVALLFFWLIGYGLVIGAHINAALANPAKERVRAHPVLDELTEAKWLDT
jgi:membrane protein